MALNSRYKRRLRDRLVRLQGGRCRYCRRLFGEGALQPTIEHLKPKRDGGRDRVANLAAACQHCNRHRAVQIERARRAAARPLAPEPAVPEQ